MLEGIDENLQLAKVDVIRGFNNCFFCVVKDSRSETYSVICLTIEESNECYMQTSVRTVYQSTSGQIIAFCTESNAERETYSYWTERDSLEVDRVARSKLWILDDQQNLVKVKQNEGGEFKVTLHLDLDAIDGIGKGIDFLLQRDYP